MQVPGTPSKASRRGSRGPRAPDPDNPAATRPGGVHPIPIGSSRRGLSSGIGCTHRGRVAAGLPRSGAGWVVGGLGPGCHVTSAPKGGPRFYKGIVVHRRLPLVYTIHLPAGHCSPKPQGGHRPPSYRALPRTPAPGTWGGSPCGRSPCNGSPCSGLPCRHAPRAHSRTGHCCSGAQGMGPHHGY